MTLRKTVICLLYVLGLGLTAEAQALDFDKEIARQEKVVTVRYVEAKPSAKKIRFTGHYKVCAKYKGSDKYDRCNRTMAYKKYQAYKQWLALNRLKEGQVQAKPFEVVLLPKGS